MAQNTPESKGSPYWAEPPMTEEEIQEQEYVLDDGYWKQPEGQTAPPCPARPESTEMSPMTPPSEQNMPHTEMPMENRPHWMMDYALAMAYVPRQKWNDIYQPDVGFSRGTIFPALDKPFIGEGGMTR
jgi:hypothetical protein